MRGRSGRTSGRATRGNSREDVGGAHNPGYQVNETYCGKGKEREGSRKRKREGGSGDGWWWRA